MLGLLVAGMLLPGGVARAQAEPDPAREFLRPPGTRAEELPSKPEIWTVRVRVDAVAARLRGTVAAGPSGGADEVRLQSVGLDDWARGLGVAGRLRFHPWLALRGEYAHVAQDGDARLDRELRFGGTTFSAGDVVRSRYELQWAATEVDVVPLQTRHMRLALPVGLRWISLRTSLRSASGRGSERTASVFVPQGGGEFTLRLPAGFGLTGRGRFGLMAALGKSGSLFVDGRVEASWTFRERFRVSAGVRYLHVDMEWVHDGFREAVEFGATIPRLGAALRVRW